MKRPLNVHFSAILYPDCTRHKNVFTLNAQTQTKKELMWNYFLPVAEWFFVVKTQCESTLQAHSWASLSFKSFSIFMHVWSKTGFWMHTSTEVTSTPTWLYQSEVALRTGSTRASKWAPTWYVQTVEQIRTSPSPWKVARFLPFRSKDVKQSDLRLNSGKSSLQYPFIGLSLEWVCM